MAQPSQIYLGLGSNLGDRAHYLKSAEKLLCKQIEACVSSPVYETKPWGKPDQPKFLNCCVGGQTVLQPKAILQFVKDIERQLGRVHRKKWGPREIDIDILFYGDQIINEPNLTIPHPHLHERAFVLVPLADLAAHFKHPLLNKTITELAAKVDNSGVHLLS